MKKKKEKSGHSTLGNCIFAVKCLHRYSPKLLFWNCLQTLSFWFFTGVVKDILLLKKLLELIVNGGSFKDYACLIGVFVFCEIARFIISSISDTRLAKAQNTQNLRHFLKL